MSSSESNTIDKELPLLVMQVNRHPTTSGSSHLLEGVFLGVSTPTQTQNSLKLPVFFT
jgi:hypothetical protein